MDLDEIWLTTRIWLGLGTAGGLVCVTLWFLGYWPAGSLFPRPRRWRPVLWGGLEVFLLFLAVLLWPEALEQLLKRRAGQLAESGLPIRFLAMALAFPLQLATVFFVLWQVRRARPRHLGLHSSRLTANLLVGFLGWLVIVPLVYAVDVLTEWLYLQWMGSPPQPHPLTELLQDKYPILEWGLFWFLAVGAAPVTEELMFRGLLQGWLLSRRWGGHLGMAAALALTGLPLLIPPAEQGSGKADTLVSAQATLLFVLALVPGYLLLPVLVRRFLGPPPPPKEETAAPADLRSVLERLAADPRIQTGWAIYATATLFAVAHPWPSPVPLFPLGLTLGWLAYRTRSLAGPILLHALFNTVGCITFALTRQ